MQSKQPDQNNRAKAEAWDVIHITVRALAPFSREHAALARLMDVTLKATLLAEVLGTAVQTAQTARAADAAADIARAVEGDRHGNA